MEGYDLTDRQEHFISLLPASKHELAEQMNVSPNTVKGYVERLRKKGIGLPYDEKAGQYYLSDGSRKVRRVSTKHKATKTREANEFITEMEKSLLRRLNSKEPLRQPPQTENGHESFCLAFGDLHFGDLVEEENGIVYDMDLAEKSAELVAENSLKVKEMMQTLVDFDDAYIFLMGDISTGEAIYEGQVWDVEDHLLNQVSRSVDSILYVIESFANNFENVHVGGVLGNHGRSRASASSLQANTDLLTYRWLEDRIHDRGWDDVSFHIGEATHYKNMKVRDWNFHLRHGHNTLKHIDSTAASSRDWRGWREKHRFDVAIRGHHHVPMYDTVLNKYPVFTTPSPKPGAEFAEMIGQPDVSTKRDLGWVFGVNDKRPVTFSYLLDDL